MLLSLIMLISYFVNYLFLDFYNADLHKMHIPNPLNYIMCTISGSLWACCLSFLLNYFKIASMILAYFGRNSLIIMTTHKEFFIVNIAAIIANSIYIIIPSFSFNYAKFLSLIFTIIMEVFIIFLLKKRIHEDLFSMLKTNRCNL